MLSEDKIPKHILDYLNQDLKTKFPIEIKENHILNFD